MVVWRNKVTVLKKYIPKDTYKNKEYYLKQLENLNNRIIKFQKARNTSNSTRIDSVINDLVLKKIYILYVLNAGYETMQPLVELFCHNMNEICKNKKIYYNDITNVLSLGFLFNISKEKLEFARENMIEEKYVDAILDLLRNKLFEDKVLTTKKFYFKEKGYFGDEYNKCYEGLMNVINANSKKEMSSEFINYLQSEKEKYYRRFVNHYKKIDEDRYTYTGSYDFRLTAIAKILGIDKEILRSSKFIAVDLMWSWES